MAEAAPALLEAQDVVAGYLPGVDILNGCSLTLAEGEIVAVVGPNGAGKSTLVKAIFGLVPVRSGRVLLEGADITALAAHDLVARRVGYVPQIRNVFPSLTVEDNLRMGAFLAPHAVAERLAAVSEVFPLVGERRAQRAG
jgi:branched-chain amino acid transport system ATP-binding protein